MRNRIFALCGIVSIAAVILVACGGNGGAEVPVPSQANTPAPVSTSPSEGDVVIVEVILDEEPFVFSPADFTFKSGQTYQLVLTSVRDFHSFTVSELGLDLFVNGGETVTHTFTPTQVGEFSLICLPHEALGMVGTVAVE